MWQQPREILGRLKIEPITVLGIWLLLAIVFGFISSSFWTVGNFLAIGQAGAALAIVSLGQCFVIVAGQFDLSVGGAVSLGGVVFVLFSNAGLPTWVAAVAAVIAVGGGLGLVNGLAAEIIGINPLIATLATLSIVEALSNILSNGLAVAAKHNSVSSLSQPTLGVIPGYAWLLIVVLLVGFVFLSRTVPGRSLYVVGANRAAATLAGLRTRALVMGAFVVCAMAAVVGGIIQASLLGAGDPSAGGSSVTLLAITAVVLGGGSLSGGRGGLGGTLAGVLLLATVADGLEITFVPSFYDGLVTGGVLLLAVGASVIRQKYRNRR
ncbi:MAG: ABC transporter permease [Ferrimicrobium sp.]